jgi:hypothetical protein
LNADYLPMTKLHVPAMIRFGEQIAIKGGQTPTAWWTAFKTLPHTPTVR